MDDLRIALIAIGAIALVGVYLWGRRRRARRDDELLDGLESWTPHGPDPLDDSSDDPLAAAADPDASGSTSAARSTLSGQPDSEGFIDGVRYPVRSRPADQAPARPAQPVQSARTARPARTRVEPAVGAGPDSSQDDPASSRAAASRPADSQVELPFSVDDREPDAASIASLAGLRADHRPSPGRRRDRGAGVVSESGSLPRDEATADAGDVSAEVWPSEYRQAESDLDAGDGRISAAMRRTQGSPTAEPPAGTGNPASARAAQPAPRVGPTSNRPAGRAEAGGASAAASSGEAQRARPPQPRPEPRPEPRPQSEPARRAGQHGEPGEETRDELEIARAVVGRASGPDIDGTTTGEASRSPAGGAQGGAQGGPRSGMSPPPQRRAGVTPEPRRRASADAPAPAAPPAPPAAADGGRQRAGRSDSGRGAAAASASGQFVVLNVLAPVGGRFEGPALVEALQLVGLRYGDMQVFHFRAPGQPGTSASLFSVLNVIKPGTLVPERMQNSNTPGVAFVMTLPPPYETPARAFETMYGVARALSDELGGRLCDETRSTLSAQALNHMRERMIEFERRSRLR